MVLRVGIEQGNRKGILSVGVEDGMGWAVWFVGPGDLGMRKGWDFCAYSGKYIYICGIERKRGEIQLEAVIIGRRWDNLIERQTSSQDVCESRRRRRC
jgi:hypothetical protein